MTEQISLSEAKPGDLVFFHSTYNSGTYVTHVGIYVGNKHMYNAGDPTGYADLTTAYWQKHLIGAGRIKWNISNKSDYEPQQPESNGTVGSDIVQEVTEFLETFFSFYPTAKDKELSYYMKDNILPPIGKDYLFTELVHPVFQIVDNQIKVWVTVKYIDEATKAPQFSQYILTLEKDTNWMIVANK